ncbi:MAG: serine/threonine protein kinase [Candidatus Latescibacterota bacterium]|nr:MAG: serine/threonine protein kinase [Candidatus Latescibacterota bacterium]
MRCENCAAVVGSEEHRFCPFCGASLELSVSDARTLLTAAEASNTAAERFSSSAAWLSSSSSLDDAFPPGTMLLGRYRIVGLLGRGGMGEVYRADDLTLGQAVALKFLPADLAGSAERMARFHHEVRIARSVSHPNVCRVYDIGDLGGRPFLSMELVDGEDLASLLRRIGRLPKDKAVDIGRQICAGLAAAHNAGVLHRDLKPGNVMLDARGRVRLTDFGLAVLAEQAHAREARAGTPAYMSPEQLEGGELTVQSDIYALGLVLYEMVTGKRPYQARSMSELAQLQRTSTPPSPSSVVEEIDAALERAILRCLEPEPTQRPRSALAVAVSLPGGDPLAAALDAGETPSPEMVAAAGEVGRLPRRVGWTCLVLALVCVSGLLPLTSQRFLVNRIPMPKAPAVLADRATELVTQLGYGEPPVDRAFRFMRHEGYLEYVERENPSVARWDRLSTGEPPAVLFWYRQSPRHLQPLRASVQHGVTLEDPPNDVSGMVTVILDPAGRLVQLLVVPPQVDSLRAAQAFDFAPLFGAAGLDRQLFGVSEPRWLPPVYCDTRAAWEGTYADAPEEPLRVEAGSYGGRAVYFEVIGPWTHPTRMQPRARDRATRVAGIAGALLSLALLGGSTLLARRNLQQGRGDRRGAWRLALFILGILFATWLIHANHAPSLVEESALFFRTFGVMLFVSGVFWVLYIALEPYVRRRWPDSIISWSRLLGGHFRDPLVGRDALIGMLLGAGTTYLVLLPQVLLPLLGKAPAAPDAVAPEVLHGPLRALFGVLLELTDAISGPLAILMLMLGLRMLLRRQWIANVSVVLLLGSIIGLTSDDPLVYLPLAYAITGIWMFTLLRFGIVTMMAGFFTLSVLEHYIVTIDHTLWYANASFVVLALMTLLLLFAFHTSMAGQLFTRSTGRLPSHRS